MIWEYTDDGRITVTIDGVVSEPDARFYQQLSWHTTKRSERVESLQAQLHIAESRRELSPENKFAIDMIGNIIDSIRNGQE